MSEKLMHKERNLRKYVLHMTAFNFRLKFVNIYMFVKCVNMNVVPALGERALILGYSRVMRQNNI